MSEFRNWKHHAITEVVMAEFQGRHDHLIEELVEQAVSLSPAELGEKIGAIKAYRDILNISQEEFDEESHGG